MNVTDVIKNFLLQKLDLNTIYIYGSYNEKRFNDNSDIDIAIILNKDTSIENLFNISCELGAWINRDVDLVDFKNSTTVLKIQILKNKNVLYCDDNEKRLQFEMIALTEYQKLNEEREIVLKSKLGGDVWMLF